MTPEFEWDARKANDNLKKHGVAFQEAVTVFANPLARLFDNPDHSENERRELIIGHSATQRLLVVIFTERESRTRIIVPGKRRRKRDGTMSKIPERDDVNRSRSSEYEFDYSRANQIGSRRA